MAASREDIKGWLDRAQAIDGCTHLIVVCDTFDYDDYPIFAKGEEDCRKKIAQYRSASMQTIEEVYDLSLSIEEQMKEIRAIHPPAGCSVK